MEKLEEEPFEVQDGNGNWIARGTYNWCQKFIEKTLTVKFMNKSKVRKWKIIERSNPNP